MDENKNNLFSFDQIRRAAIIYIVLPLFCFCCGFLKWYYTVICCIALLLIVWKAFKRTDNLEKMYQGQRLISFKTIILVFAFTLLWSYLGGMNGYFYQSSDWDCRNAVYFDLIRYKWPVTYEQNGAALVYYVGHWLPPAAIAKLFQVFSGSVEIGRSAGRILLWTWSSMGLSIIILMLFHVVGAMTRRRRFFTVFLFVFFSGMDIVGAIIRHRLGYLLEPERMHLEWWIPGLQYSSMTTCLFWVFNQAIIPWMITLCFLTEEDPSNYVLYGTSCLLCGTLPCIGLVVLMVVKATGFIIRSARKTRNLTVVIRIFSLQNILSFLVVFPIVAAFILSANTVGNTFGDVMVGSETEAVIESQGKNQVEDNVQSNIAAKSTANKAGLTNNGTGKKKGIFFIDYRKWELLLFVALEAGFYLLCIWPDHLKEPLFYTLIACFLLFPYIHVGDSYDFCMRASIPGIFILMLYIIRFLFIHFPYQRIKIKGQKPIKKTLAVVLAVCFAIGMMTPIVEFYRGTYHVIEKQTLFLEDQSLMTFNHKSINHNFMCSKPDERLFFKYFAK